MYHGCESYIQLTAEERQLYDKYYHDAQIGAAVGLVVLFILALLLVWITRI